MLRFTLIFFAFLQSVSANAAVVAVCESLVAGDPFLSERIKLDYIQSSDLALADFARQFPGSNHEIKYCLEPKSPEEILSTSLPPRVSTIVGFTFTSSAKVAANFANQVRLLFIAPTSSLDELFLGSYSMSRGLPITKTAELMTSLINNNRAGDQRVQIYSPFDVAYARFMKRAILGSLHGPFNLHDYIQVDAEAMNNDESIRNYDLVVFTGYAFQHFKTLSRLLNKFGDIKYFGTNQWAYNQDVLRLILAQKKLTDLSVISDFVDAADDLMDLDTPKFLSDIVSESSVRSKSFLSGFVARYKRVPEPFSYAVYDAVYTALLINQKTLFKGVNGTSRINLGWISGVSGPAQIKDGVISRPAYLLKWQDNRLVAQKMFL